MFVFASCRSHDLETPHSFPADEPQIQPPFQKIIEFSDRTKFKRETPAPSFRSLFRTRARHAAAHARQAPAGLRTRGRADQRPRQPAGARPPPGELEATVAGPQPARRAQPGAEAGELTFYAMLEQKKGRFFFFPGGWIAYQFACAAPHFRPQFLPNNSY